LSYSIYLNLTYASLRSNMKGNFSRFAALAI
jgi:hypothetical protein